MTETQSSQYPCSNYDASSGKGSVNDRLQIAWKPLALPQYPGSNYDDPWMNHVYQSMPCDAQDPTNTASELEFAPQSLFSTFPPVPFSLGPIDGSGFDFEAWNKNMKQYELWDGPQGENNNQGDPNTIDGSFYMISRNPFGPIGRSFPQLPSSYELADLGFV